MLENLLVDASCCIRAIPRTAGQERTSMVRTGARPVAAITGELVVGASVVQNTHTIVGRAVGRVQRVLEAVPINAHRASLVNTLMMVGSMTLVRTARGTLTVAQAIAAKIMTVKDAVPIRRVLRAKHVPSHAQIRARAASTVPLDLTYTQARECLLVNSAHEIPTVMLVITAKQAGLEQPRDTRVNRGRA